LTAVSERKPIILHVSTREMLRPLRDQVLRVNGFEVESTAEPEDALIKLRRRDYDLVLIDVEGEGQIPKAESLCSAVKTEKPNQMVGFVCNYRVAILTDCPDEIIRSEFNPEAFVLGVRDMLEQASK
jgi:DNA-binding response OmpR family regulator